MAYVRLIDANALIEKLHQKIRRIDNGRSFRGETMTVDDGMRLMELEYCIGLVQCADVIDAVPAAHGRWKPDMYFDQHVMRCTVCNHGFVEGHRAERFSFCPHCGAKMDAKKDLVSEFSAHVASMSDDDVRASIQNAERLTAGCAQEEE